MEYPLKRYGTPMRVAIPPNYARLLVIVIDNLGFLSDQYVYRSVYFLFEAAERRVRQRAVFVLRLVHSLKCGKLLSAVSEKSDGRRLYRDVLGKFIIPLIAANKESQNNSSSHNYGIR